MVTIIWESFGNLTLFSLDLETKHHQKHSLCNMRVVEGLQNQDINVYLYINSLSFFSFFIFQFPYILSFSLSLSLS